MAETIVTALITGGLTLLGVLISNSKAQAVMEEKVNELTREVREHNGFARRLPVVEERLRALDQRVVELEHNERKERPGA